MCSNTQTLISKENKSSHDPQNLQVESLNFQVLFFAHCYPEKLGVVIYACNPSTQEENHHQFQNHQSCIVKNQQKLERQIPLKLSLHPVYSVSLKSELKKQVGA